MPYPIPIQVHLPPVKWTPRNVVRWIKDCRNDFGIPLFRTKYGKVPFSYNGKPAVMAICLGGRNRVGSVLFYDVPKEDIELMEREKGEWVYLLEKYEKLAHEKGKVKLEEEQVPPWLGQVL